MMKTFAAVLYVMMAVTANADELSPLKLTSEDDALVKSTIANQLMYPDRAEYTAFRVKIDPEEGGTDVVCGEVSAIESNGFRGPSRPFIVLLTESEDGVRTPFLGSGPALTAAEKSVVEMFCSNLGLSGGTPEK